MILIYDMREYDVEYELKIDYNHTLHSKARVIALDGKDAIESLSQFLLDEYEGSEIVSCKIVKEY